MQTDISSQKGHKMRGILKGGSVCLEKWRTKEEGGVKIKGLEFQKDLLMWGHIKEPLIEIGEKHHNIYEEAYN